MEDTSTRKTTTHPHGLRDDASPAMDSAMEAFRLQLCDIQGRLFELSGERRYPTERFAKAFMEGPTAAHYDLPYDRAQWMGEEYLLEEVEDEARAAGTPLTPAPEGDASVYPRETLYWMGFLYRYWHLLTGESSEEIHRIAPAATMRAAYPGFHAIDNELAIANLRELGARQPKRPKAEGSADCG